MSSEMQISLFDQGTGRSDSMAVAGSMTVADLLQLATALFGLAAPADQLLLIKDGKALNGGGGGGGATGGRSITLQQAGVTNGDLLAVADRSSVVETTRAAADSRSNVGSGSGGGGGLDFSNLLGSASASTGSSSGGGSGGGLNFSNLLAASSTTSNNNNSAPPSAAASTIPVYYDGMTLDDAMDNNPHPQQIVALLQSQSRLFKELNHHNPTLARKLLASPSQAVQTWRQHAVQTGIQNAMRHTKVMQLQQQMTQRLQRDPNDAEAKAYFHKQEQKKLIQQQYFQAMQEYPESMTKVLMLYIETKINGHSVQTFVDSGAQVSVMSKACARRCGLLDLVDERFAGYALGVGRGKILGRVHIAHLQIGETHFPFTITVMDNEGLPTAAAASKPQPSSSQTHQDMDFLLGLDMLKRHLCTIDLQKGVLRFQLPSDRSLETPFLHEKDLPESKGGTKGFDADRSNAEVEENRMKQEAAAAAGKDEDEEEAEENNGEGDGDGMETS
mmetsp:Transcript_16647/g.46609  ORF Transcript_16647/g.46609 Transcript_16647/m.46609 type:complete len:502 (+) Transcript_16647:105-1610(+)